MKNCIHCNMPVKGSEARLPLFPAEVQWGIHIHSDKFQCYWNEEREGPKTFAEMANA